MYKSVFSKFFPTELRICFSDLWWWPSWQAITPQNVDHSENGKSLGTTSLTKTPDLNIHPSIHCPSIHHPNVLIPFQGHREPGTIQAIVRPRQNTYWTMAESQRFNWFEKKNHWIYYIRWVYSVKLFSWISSRTISQSLCVMQKPHKHLFLKVINYSQYSSVLFVTSRTSTGRRMHLCSCEYVTQNYNSGQIFSPILEYFRGELSRWVINTLLIFSPPE